MTAITELKMILASLNPQDRERLDRWINRYIVQLSYHHRLSRTLAESSRKCDYHQELMRNSAMTGIAAQAREFLSFSQTYADPEKVDFLYKLYVVDPRGGEK